jgi:hypothetical protein
MESGAGALPLSVPSLANVEEADAAAAEEHVTPDVDIAATQGEVVDVVSDDEAPADAHAEHAEQEDASDVDDEGKAEHVVTGTGVKLALAPGIMIVETRSGRFARWARDPVLKKALCAVFKNHTLEVNKEYITLCNRPYSMLKKLCANKSYTLVYNPVLRSRERALARARADYAKNAPKAIKAFHAAAPAIVTLLSEHKANVVSKGVMTEDEERAVDECIAAWSLLKNSVSVYASPAERAAAAAERAGSGAGACSASAEEGKPRKRARSETCVAEDEAHARAIAIVAAGALEAEEVAMER